MYVGIFVFMSISVSISADSIGMDGIDAEFASAFDQQLYEEVLNSTKCKEQLDILAKNGSISINFADASGKLPSGITLGNLADLGNYYQCLSLRHEVDDMEIEGKYCMLQIPLQQEPKFDTTVPVTDNTNAPNVGDISLQLDNNTADNLKQFMYIQRQAQSISGAGRPLISRVLPAKFVSAMNMSLGTCIPKVCRTTEAINFILHRNNLVSNMNYSELFCRLPNDKPYSIADYLALIIFTLIAFVTVISTTYDLYLLFVLKKDSSQVNKFYRCFSIYTNTKRFLTFNTVPGALECIDGIRTISMLWVIFGHCYCLTMLNFVSNIQYVLSWITSFKSIWINAAPITVDTFFTLSGILCVYTVIGKISRWKFIKSLHFFYLYRLLRIFPLLAAVVLLQASLFHRVSDGPMWVNMGHVTAMCRKRWWSALLHVQNYVKPIGICLYQTWYLSVDIQLYIISPVVLVWLFGSTVTAWCALATAIVVSLILSSVFSFLYNYSAALATPSRVNDFGDYFSDYYMNTLTRASPFFIGMLYGYLLHLYREKEIYIKKVWIAIAWIVAFALMSFCIFTNYPILQPDHTDQTLDNFLNAYMRGMWAVAIGWLIFACVHGYGGPINWFLSLQMWKLPARLSYAMYLLHYPIMMVANGSMTTTYYFSDANTLYRAMSDLTFTTIAAFVLSITIDAPFSTIQKLLLGGKKKTKNNNTTESRTNIVEEERNGKNATFL